MTGYETVDATPVTVLGVAPITAIHLPTGDFFMTATVQVRDDNTQETASCALRDGLNNIIASYTGSITLNPQFAGEITLTGFNTNGGTTTLTCNDSNVADTIVVTESVITAIPVTTLHTG